MSPRSAFVACFFFFNDTATTEIYTLSLHDALPIYPALAELPQHLIAGIEDLVRERGGAVEARPFGRSGWRAHAGSRVRGAGGAGALLHLDEQAALAGGEPRGGGVNGPAPRTTDVAP